MKPFERLLKYISIRTPSDEASTTVPSSTCQFELAWHLHRELFTMGITDWKGASSRDERPRPLPGYVPSS